MTLELVRLQLLKAGDVIVIEQRSNPGSDEQLTYTFVGYGDVVTRKGTRNGARRRVFQYILVLGASGIQSIIADDYDLIGYVPVPR